MSTLMNTAVATDNTSATAAAPTTETPPSTAPQEGAAPSEAPKVENIEAPKAPQEITYTDFALPEGFEFKSDILNKFTSAAKELKLDQPSAQKMVDIATEHAKMIIDSQAEQLAKTRESWVESIKTDKDFGGGKFNETIERAQRSLKTYGSNELVDILNSSGLGDNPEVIKLLAKIDKATSDDRIIDGRPNNNTGKAPAEIIYGF